MSVTLCVLLWAVPGREDLLGDYEDAVLDLLPKHQGRVLSRVRNLEVNESPTEVQVVEMASQAALDSFMVDPVRLALSPLRDQCIERTELIRVTQI